MEIKNYIIVNNQTNIVSNIVAWSGNTDEWNPPENHFAVPIDAAKTKSWVLDSKSKDFVIAECEVSVAPGFTWDGTYFITNELKPELLPPASNQPNAIGTQTV